MIRVLIMTLALFLPWVAAAQPIAVLSGDHADFSRLVLNGDVGPDWEFGRVDGGYEFRANRTEIVWDLARAFDRISRTRIAEVGDLGGGRLFIGVTCACYPDAFDLRAGKIVLDIKDGPPPAGGTPFDAPLPAIEPPENAPPIGATEGADPWRTPAMLPARSGVLPASPQRAGLPLTVPRRSNGLKVALEDASAPPPAPSPVADALPAPNPQSNRVTETGTALMEQIARAAAQGLLDADLSRIEDGIQAITQPHEPERQAQSLPEPAAPASPGGHISIETSVDRASPAARSGSALTDDGARCLERSLFDVAKWGTAAGADIGAYRRQILGEFDAPNASRLTEFARHYIYLSFGAETIALVNRYQSEMTRPDLLVAMAEIMDHGTARMAPELVAQMACDGETALWATLAQPQLNRGQTINATAVSLSFAALPAHLRSHLGPRLAGLFIDIDDTTTAARIRNATDRAEPESGVGAGVVSARLDLASGRTELALERLDALVMKDSDDLTEALLARVETALDTRAAIAPDHLSLLESVAFEQAKGEQGRRLASALVRAKAANGAFGDALAQLEAGIADGLVTSEQSFALRDEIFLKLTENASDATLLETLVPRLDATLDLPASTRRSLAERVLALGLAVPARRILAGHGDLPGADDRLLYARAALVEGRPEIAIGYLAGLKDEAAAQVRAEALARAGDFDGAVQVLRGIGDAPNASLAAWRGGLWPDVSAPENRVLAQAAGLMLDNRPRQLEDQPNSEGEAASATPLAQSRALVDDSRATRAILDALLEGIGPIPATATPEL